ncbi:unnamed protein product [Caenorhabditis bovis]|uniref:Arrestin C-terminal-like domain-containing protein n=1 Tax=Caenorhabditis bovis TaxID=2654633 RepID=A0A8S1ETF0_9PELO|nr:unnamed protein product [Caenorhabditis bovis]
MDYPQIEFDNRGVFFPGYTASGRVTLHLSEPMKARMMKIVIEGKAHTHWSETERHSKTDHNGKTETHSETVHYSATVPYMNGECLLWTSTDGKNKMPVGNYTFPFTFAIPINCPPSFEGFHGCVRYTVKAEIDRPWRFNRKNCKPFSVIPSSDLNMIPLAINPMTNTISKNTGLIFKNGVVSMRVDVPKQGFVPGETIQINVFIDNNSSKQVTMARAKLVQNSTYFAKRGWSFYQVDPCAMTNHGATSVRHESKQPINIAPRSKSHVLLTLRIPAIVSSFNNCPIISVSYKLHVHADTTSTFKGSLCSEFPIIIGTVPIRQFIPQTTNFASSAPPAHPSQMPSAPSAPPDIPTPTAPSDDSIPPPYPDDLNRVFSPGSTVSGEVILHLNEPMAARLLTIEISGCANTYWTKVVTREKKTQEGKSHFYNETVHYNSNVIYLKDARVLWTCPENSNIMQAGRYILHFSFSIPSDCPPSFEGEFGYIRYSVKTVLDRPWRFNKQNCKAFTVIPLIDLNKIPLTAMPLVGNAAITAGNIILKKGIVLMRVEVPKNGFVPGESIQISIHIENNCRKRVVLARATLTQKATYFAELTKVKNRHTSQYMKPHKREERRMVTESQQPINIMPHSRGHLKMSLRIPSVSPTFTTCSIITVEYELRVYVESNAKHHRRMHLDLPILIGTVPITPNPRKIAPNCRFIQGPTPTYEESIFGPSKVTPKIRNVEV